MLAAIAAANDADIPLLEDEVRRAEYPLFIVTLVDCWFVDSLANDHIFPRIKLLPNQDYTTRCSTAKL